MKQNVFILLMLVVSINCQSQSVTRTQKVDAFIKVWGFLKYYHPIVADSKDDWDSVFVAKVKEAEQIATVTDYNSWLQKWINSLGDYKKMPVQRDSYDKANTLSTPMLWLTKNVLLSTTSKNLISDILRHRKTGNSHYLGRDEHGTQNANFVNEKAYLNMFFPDEPHRLLALARFWNMIEYFYPYKHLTDVPWDQVPAKMIATFINAKNAADYPKALSMLTAFVNDSHSTVGIPGDYPVKNPWFTLPVAMTVIENKAVVTTVYNDSLAKLLDLKLGDVVISINDTSVSDHVLRLKPMLAASNESIVLREGIKKVASGVDRFINIAIERNGNIQNRRVERFNGFRFKQEQDTTPAWKMLDDNIGYIHTGKLAREDVKAVIQSLFNTKGLIFDLRTYPQWTLFEICTLLGQGEKPFAKCSYPDYNYPGAFLVGDMNTIGESSDNPYQGKITILINETTQSRAEWTTMAYQTLKNAKIIGSQTSGADGNATAVYFPGGFSAWMTGLGVYYPDGKATQRIGIVPDILCKPTIKGYRAAKDEVLERAIQYIME